MNTIRLASGIGALLSFALISACSDDSSNGNAGTGGTVSTGGTNATGGTTDTGGSSTGGTSSTGGATSTGGTASGGAATGGAASGGADAGGQAGSAGCPVTWTGSATRPQLDDASAECFTIKNFLAASGTIGALTKDDWDPTAGLPEASTLTPAFTVAADGSGTHTTVQAAIDAANMAGGTERVNILVKPGTYRELVCVKGTVPITLYGADEDATQVTIAFDNYSGKTVDMAHVNACASPSGTTYGTSASSTFFVSANGFQAMNLTLSNDFEEGTVTSSIQAVAMTAQADKVVFQNVRFIGNQDTLQLKSPAGTSVARSYFKGSYVEGDTDFIFGRGTAVFDDCTINYVTARKPNGAHFAPSTESTNGFGFLVVNSKITSDSATPAATASLGRAWDESSAASPNGQTIVRESEIGAHVPIAAPWAAAATSSRAFDANKNRFFEYKNTGPGAAP